MQENLITVKLEMSQKEFEVARQFVTGGVHSAFRYREPFPIYFNKAQGSRVWDIDGNEYIDFLVANGACILGHRNPKVIAAVERQLQTGLTVGLESELSTRVARLLHEMIPSAEVTKLSNTGTESVMHAIQIARGYTHKSNIVKTEGCYHGWQDEAHLSVHPKLNRNGLSPAESSTRPIPESEGYAPYVIDSVSVVPYNDAKAFEEYARENKGKVAALIIEPVLFNSGCIPPKDGYLQELREITQRYDILLIFDEVVTGFRMAPGGAQEYYRVKPDISTFGKAIANGFPLSAVVGIEDVMRITEPKGGRVTFAGTYNGSQSSLAAAEACLDQLRDGSIQDKLQRDSRTLVKRFEESAEEHDVPARLQSMGGQFQIYFTEERVTDYRTAARSDKSKYTALCESLMESGMLFHQSYLFHHGVSKAHTAADIENLSSKLDGFLRRVEGADANRRTA
jgi:glutamate-1-semialdehyde 2,1-aminomutase